MPKKEKKTKGKQEKEKKMCKRKEWIKSTMHVLLKVLDSELCANNTLTHKPHSDKQEKEEKNQKKPKREHFVLCYVLLLDSIRLRRLVISTIFFTYIFK